MSVPRVPLHDRLPEIYRIHAQQSARGPLAACHGAVEGVFSVPQLNAGPPRFSVLPGPGATVEEGA